MSPYHALLISGFMRRTPLNESRLMIVSIGMLAYNEAAGIANTIRSLLAQSAFHPNTALPEVTSWELVVVPNGCTDETAHVANAAIKAGVSALGDVTFEYSVRSLERGGKSNAWNQYIHEMSRRDADVIVMVDSDIEFGHIDTLRNCLHELARNPVAKVVVDLPLKDFTKRSRLSWTQKLSARNSSIQLQSDVGIAGSFYCARAETLRQIWMPPGLSGEDGFLKGMIVTDLFRSEPDFRKVARAENASHYYEGLSDLKGIFQHELRMVIGTCMNCYFMWDFLRFATDPTGPGAGVMIRDRLAQDSTWYRRTLENQIRCRGLFVIPSDMRFRRLAALRGLAWRELFRRLPVALAGSALDLITFLRANARIRSGRAFGFW